MCLPICVSVGPWCSLFVAYGRGSVLFWWRCSMLCIVAYSIDDALSAHKGSYWGMLLLLQEVTSLNSCAQVNALAASYLLVVAPHFRQRGAPRLDGSIMQGVPGAEPAMRCCLVISHSVCNLYMVLTWHLAAFNDSISSNDALHVLSRHPLQLHNGIVWSRLPPSSKTYMQPIQRSRDVSLRNDWRYLLQWYCMPPYGSLCANVTSSIRPEVHNVSQSRRPPRRTEPRPTAMSYMHKNVVKVVRVGLFRS